MEGFIHLNEIAGANGVGRIDIVENRFVGIKSRGCYETPAGTVLREAHLDLEGITMDREVMRIRDTLSAEFSRLCYYGFWYAPEMELVMNSINFSQKGVTGAVEMKLYKGIHWSYRPYPYPHPHSPLPFPTSTYPHLLLTYPHLPPPTPTYLTFFVCYVQAMRLWLVASLLVHSTVLI